MYLLTGLSSHGPMAACAERITDLNEHLQAWTKCKIFEGDEWLCFTYIAHNSISSLKTGDVEALVHYLMDYNKRKSS